MATNHNAITATANINRPQARRVIAPCEDKKPKAGLAYEDFGEPKQGRRKKRNKKATYQAHRDRDQYIRSHRTSHGYRLAARSVTEMLGAESALQSASEMDALREENRELQQVVTNLLQDLTGERNHISCLQEIISALRQDNDVLRTEAAYWRTTAKNCEEDADYWQNRAILAETESPWDDDVDE